MAIIVIGAGIAGLAAANELKAHGESVIVLEARDIIGGRIRTDHSLGIPLSLGPQWIHGSEGNPLVKLANDTQTKIQETSFIGNPTAHLRVYDQQNELMPDDYIEQYSKHTEQIVTQCKQYAMNQAKDISFLAALNAIQADSQHLAYADAIYQQALLYVRLYFNGDPNIFSARYGNEEERFPGSDQFVLDGFMPICELLAAGLDIRFNTSVSAIAYDDDKVTVVASGNQYIVDAVIITVSLGALKNDAIRFTPPLPDKHRQAIEHLKMGFHDTLALQFNKVYWPTNCNAFCFLKADTIFPVIINLHHYYGQPILSCKIGGDKAEALESCADTIWIEKAMQQLRMIFGHSIPDPINHTLMRWGRDAYTLGSYSYIPVGANTTDYYQLGLPVQHNVLFAGEATQAEYPATVHGAYLSGLRAARALV